MKKIVIIFLLFTAIALSQSNLVSFAKENNGIDFRAETKNIISNIKNDDSNDKNKFQLRIDNRKNNFMIKGVITASESNTLTIKNTLIKIDPSVTGAVKIEGETNIGMYAMAQGIIKDSGFYANKIIVNQRNKHDLDDNDDTITPTPTISPTIIATPTPTVIATGSAEIEEPQNLSEDLGLIIERIQEFLNYLKDIASKI